MTGSAERRAVFLREIGVGPVWQRRAAVPPQQHPSTEFAVEVSQPAAFDDMPIDMPPLALPEMDKPVARDVAVPEVSSMDWGQLQSAVAACTKCGLCTGRTRTVFGVGDEKAKWLFVGEGPGRNEDLRGEPFVGQAGKLLDNMLLAMGLKRGENAYIANIVKCRPTDETGRDRAPTAVETAACMPYLERQIALIQPTVIVALGKTAAISLLGLDAETPVSKLRGTVHRYADRPLVVTYHPAYLLRNMADKKKAWADICLAMTAYAGVR
ncbi:uracil-DNA glycosylase [Noviherbaspirillum sp.]|jgi:DNA polymerase|uniref:uracil-DNA glycosylase n=1 Tax=Noviherbaspirillum sp. TaxID=1926288 RepID=UPI0025E0CABB|nr:uracil-DNA glycosylase [Noviherbaspirillum sp.]